MNGLRKRSYVEEVFLMQRGVVLFQVFWKHSGHRGERETEENV